MTLLPLLTGLAAAQPVPIPLVRTTLDNGLTVILHPDPSLPMVVVNTLYDVGSKDEVPGRTGFAHLFEHLMFMGTTRLPGSGFDDRMEQYGGWNNAWTSEDATNYYDVGPKELLPTLLWMEADRMEGLDQAMTRKKLALQRDVVRNERRQSVEDSPYGIAWETLPAAMFPAGHPYAHSVIGTHEDLKAATVQDVVGFFNTWYVPNNAILVVAGDFEVPRAQALIEQLFGPIPRAELPARAAHPAPDRPVTPLVELTDRVQLAGSALSWHTAPALSDEDAAMDLLATILSEGRSSRLYQRLVVQEAVASEVDAMQLSQQLSSVFLVFTLALPGIELPRVEALVQEEIDRLAAEGPTPDELERARNRIEMDRLHELEELTGRAEALARYQMLLGTPDGLAQDLDRYARASAADVKAAAARLGEARRQTMRIHPAGESK